MDDKVLGDALLVGSPLDVGCFFYPLFIFPWANLVVQFSAFTALAATLAVIPWIGCTLTVTS